MKDKGKLLMLFFIGSEAFFFLALIIAYVYYRNYTHTTDTVAENLDVVRAGFYTLFLIASSFTLIFSKRALEKQKFATFKLLMGITILFGIIFMAGQVTEYIGLYSKQVRLDKDIFGSIFFTLTGFHGFHVTLGLVALLILFALSFGKMKSVTQMGFEGAGVYWHFVDVVWLFVFYFVYITPLL